MSHSPVLLCSPIRPMVIGACIVCALLALSSGARGEPEPAPAHVSAPASFALSPLTLEACLEQVRVANPAVGATWHGWLSAVGAAGGAGSLPDPVFTYGYFIHSVETRVGPQERRLAVKQTLPWFGKLRLRSEAARAGADAAYQRYRRAVADAVYEATEAYVEYANLRVTIEILERRTSLLSDLEEAVRARYAAGDAPYADLMRAQIERASASDRLAAARGRRAPASARLAAALGMTPAEPLPWPDSIPRPTGVGAGDAVAGLARSNPELLMIESEIRKAESSRSLARRGYFPDLDLGADYIVTGDAVMRVDESGKDPLSVSASMSVPLWFGKHAAEVREQSERLVAVKEMKRQKENELSARLQMVLFDMDDSRRRIDLYESEMVPDSERSLESARAAYGNGAVGFETVVAAEQMLLEMELSLELALVDAATAAASLDRLMAVGTPVEAPEVVGDTPTGGNGR